MVTKSLKLACLFLLFSFMPQSPLSPQTLNGQEQNPDSRLSGDWPMFGSDIGRNQVNESKGVSFDFRLRDPDGDEAIQPNEKILWTAELGSQTYGAAVVSQGRVFVGTNNNALYRPMIKGDRGVLLCFEEETGKFLWQLSRDKLAEGRSVDVPLTGIVSVPFVEQDRLWVVTNRAELMCLDVAGFTDEENDGVVQNEVDSQSQDADIVWSLDMKETLNVVPHNLATSSPVVFEDLVYVLTSNGVEPNHSTVASPDAPSFLAVNKRTGKVAWQARPANKILHGQWSSPSIGIVNGQPQVYFSGGDGWLYAYDARKGDLIWKFDLNLKIEKWDSFRGSRLIGHAMPVFFEDSVVIATGCDPEHGGGPAYVFRIDATQKGDVSEELGERGKNGTPNPNSGLIWKYGGQEPVAAKAGQKEANKDSIFGRSLSTAAIGDGMVFLADLEGFLHCIDWETGQRNWRYDMLSITWGSPLLVDQKLLLGNEDGDLLIFDATKANPGEPRKIATQEYRSIYSTPVIANGKLFIVDRAMLYVVSIKP